MAIRNLFIGAQMLTVAFGALVLVPLLTGLDPAVALFTAGVGTLVFHFLTGFRVPIFLASSFAFIAPITYGVQTFGLSATMGGLCAAGLVYVALSLLVRWRGVQFLHRLLPPVVVGPVVMLIGLMLAPVAVNMAIGKTGDGSVQLFAYHESLIVGLIAFGATVITSLFGRGIWRLLPILVGIVVGSIAAFLFDMVDFSAMQSADWFSVPNFQTPTFSWEAILFILPVAIAPVIEHVGDVLAISSVTGEDFMEEPGLHKTMLGDGVATMVASFLGGPPNTTYSEVTGAVALTRSFDPKVMVIAACVSIVLAFFGKLGAILQSVPTPVMGGILILLFGTIAVVGMSQLVKGQVDLMKRKNMITVSTILICGVGGMLLKVGTFQLQGLGLAAILGVLLNLILPEGKEEL